MILEFICPFVLQLSIYIFGKCFKKKEERIRERELHNALKKLHPSDKVQLKEYVRKYGTIRALEMLKNAVDNPERLRDLLGQDEKEQFQQKHYEMTYTRAVERGQIKSERCSLYAIMS